VERCSFPRAKANGLRDSPVAVAGYLRYVVKMPFEAVRKILGGLLDLTLGALVCFDKKPAETGRPLYEQLADII